ncbi:MAG: hypothetical protein JO189_21745 [Deltaproteobacteria bacterium]|nr:hypothetical protein [Deltaproteobacteria bacterium]
MRKHYLFVLAAQILCAAPVHAQCLIGCGSGPIPVADEVTEENTSSIAASIDDIDSNELPEIVSIEQENILPGMADGFDWSQTLQGDLEQQVDSAGGMALTQPDLANYTTNWPGYTNASYDQNPPPGSPEGNMATILGTLQGALEAGADQQQSQTAEAARMAQLEANIAAAVGNLQMLEVIGEIDLFNGQEEIKSRNSINGQLNALLVAESNRQSQKAQDDLESIAIAGEQTDWDLTNGNMQEQDPQIPDAGLSE